MLNECALDSTCRVEHFDIKNLRSEVKGHGVMGGKGSKFGTVLGRHWTGGRKADGRGCVFGGLSMLIRSFYVSRMRLVSPKSL